MNHESLITVVSVRGIKPHSAPPNLIYIGRRCASWPQSPLANPYKLQANDIREDVIDQYRRHLWACVKRGDSAIITELTRIAGMVQRGESVQFGCWCSPLPCHGDVVKEAILWWIANKIEVSA